MEEQHRSLTMAQNIPKRKGLVSGKLRNEGINRMMHFGFFHADMYEAKALQLLCRRLSILHQLIF